MIKKSCYLNPLSVESVANPDPDVRDPYKDSPLIRTFRTCNFQIFIHHDPEKSDILEAKKDPLQRDIKDNNLKQKS